MINVVCGIRSTGRICTDLATALEKQGHEVKIAYGRESVPEQFGKYAVKIGSKADVIIHGVKARLFDACGFGSREATKKFIEWVIKYDPDVIHLHNIHGYYINIEVLFEFLRTCGKRIIWTLHDCWAFTGHTAYCDAMNCEKWENGCNHCPCKNEYPKTIVDFSKRNWNKKKRIFCGIPNLTIISPSNWLQSLAKRSFLKEYKTIVINNGINTKVFYHRESSFKEKNGIANKFMLLGVATTWDNMKGLDDYIKLADALDDRFITVLVGVSQKQMRMLSNKMIGIERTNDIHELAEIYSAADLYVNLSHCENYPTVNIESLACGTPVLTYDVGGSAEIAKEYNGYTVKKGDISAVITTICSIADNGILPLSFDWNTHDKSETMRNYLKVYN